MTLAPLPLIEPKREEALLRIASGQAGDREAEQRVERALGARPLGLGELAALLSPAADAYLEQMAQKARALTRKHFGRTIELYIPLYISNECSSGCDYCGFAADRKVQRRRLSLAEIEREIAVLARQGFDEVLLLTGERAGEADLIFLEDAVRLCRAYVTRVTVEAFPLQTEEYARLVRAGLFGITIYQETYDRELYRQVHRWGPKRDYDFRLHTPERALRAGVRGVGLGALLGLGEADRDLLRVAAHLDQLYRRYWQAYLSVSFPRLRPEAGGRVAARPVGDRELVRYIFAFRIALPKIHLVLSTRESVLMRDNLAGVGISKMSVGSHTTVGGYEHQYGDARQFELADERTCEQFCQTLAERGLVGVYKNWDTAFI